MKRGEKKGHKKAGKFSETLLMVTARGLYIHLGKFSSAQISKHD